MLRFLVLMFKRRFFKKQFYIYCVLVKFAILDSCCQVFTFKLEYTFQNLRYNLKVILVEWNLPTSKISIISTNFRDNVLRAINFLIV